MSCKFCMGYGWWPIGHLCPIGRMDAGDWGDHIIKCPWCAAGNEDSGDRWDALIKEKEKRDINNNDAPVAITEQEERR